MPSLHRVAGLTLTFALLVLPAWTGQAQGLKKLETKNLRFLYSPANEFVVPHVARSFENAWQFHQHQFDYTTRDKVTLIIEDFGDYGNGGASTIPRNAILYSIAPFGHNYGADLFAERVFATMNHEAVHIVAGDRAARSDKFFRTLFGGKVASTASDPVTVLYSYLASPRAYAPRWYAEGVAVFLETWMGGGLGRALASYDEMVFRTMVRDSVRIYDFVGLESEGTTVDFQVGANSYLYGTRFISYLVLEHGPGKFMEWVARSDSSRKSYTRQFKNVYSVSLDDAWADWIIWERNWQKANLEKIRQHPITAYRPLASKPLGSVSRPILDRKSGKLYFAVRRPGHIAHFAEMDLQTGRIRKLHDIRGAGLYYVSSVAFDEKQNRLFYTSDNRAWRDLNVLDLRTGESRQLQRNFRTGDIAFNASNNTLWGVRHFNGLSSLVRIAPPYDEWKVVKTFPFGHDLYDLDISPDGGLLVASKSDVSGNQLLVMANIDSLIAGLSDFETLADFDHSAPMNFVFSPDGRHLFGSSYFSGVANIYRYDMESGQVDPVTNAETGFFRPYPISADSLLAFEYTGGGFLPVMIPIQRPDRISATSFLGTAVANKYEQVRAWQLGSPARVNLDSLTVEKGFYDPIKHVTFESWYPIVQGFKDVAAVGVRLNFSDYIGVSGLDVSASVSPSAAVPDDERFHVSANFRHLRWRVSATYNKADFYDLFGPTKTGRKGYSLGVNYGRVLSDEDSYKLRYDVRAVGWGGLDRLPDAQNVSASFSEFLSGGASLNYNSIHKSLGAVDDEKGFDLTVSSDNRFVNGKLFPRIRASYDIGRSLPISHSSLWLRMSSGLSIGERSEPFANFYFGGFGNNWVDHQNEKRYRDYYSFPGVELNSIGGTNFVKALVEWNLPPLRFRRVGLPNLYLRWARPALFTSGIVTNLDDAGVRRSVATFGAQLDFQIVVFTRLTMTLSAGYASAVERDQAVADEWMISLKVL